MSDLFLETGAVFSECGQYRYRLWRYWDRTKPAMCFLMLNPSTADDVSNDATVERCQRRAMLMGFGGVEVVNIFAYRSTDPTNLYDALDPVGPENDQAIRDACVSAGLVVCAWGDHGQLHRRSDQVIQILSEIKVVPHALKINESGEPQHPLYISYAKKPFPYGQARKTGAA